jgi:nitrogen-specific signal transduction histidine kinase
LVVATRAGGAGLGLALSALMTLLVR